MLYCSDPPISAFRRLRAPYDFLTIVLLIVSSAPLSPVFTWIMSQRILIHLQAAAAKLPHHTPPPIIHPPNPDSDLNAHDVVRPRPRDTERHGLNKHTDSSSMGSSCITSEPVQVHVEHSVVVGVRPHQSSPDDESTRTPMVKWNEGLVSRSR